MVVRGRATPRCPGGCPFLFFQVVWEGRRNKSPLSGAFAGGKLWTKYHT